MACEVIGEGPMAFLDRPKLEQQFMIEAVIRRKRAESQAGTGTQL